MRQTNLHKVTERVSFHGGFGKMNLTHPQIFMMHSDNLN
jgi:hypothetical protein